MSIISQIAMIVLILLTGIILIYANKGLANAALEGEKFVDEWALRQLKKEEKEKSRAMRSITKSSSRWIDGSEEEQEEMDEEEIAEGAFFVKKDHGQFDGSFEEDDWSNPARRKELAVQERIQLIMLDEEKNQTKTIEIDHCPYSIGRDQSNDLSLNDLYVAKFHCQIREENGHFLLEDLGTANKIYADGNMVSQMILKNQDHFYIGGCEFVVKDEKHRSQPTVLAWKAERA